MKGMFLSLAIFADLYLYTRTRPSKTCYLKMWPSFGDHKAVKLKTRPKHATDVGEEGKEEQGTPTTLSPTNLETPTSKHLTKFTLCVLSEQVDCFSPFSILHMTKGHVLTQIKHWDLQYYRGSKDIR